MFENIPFIFNLLQKLFLLEPIEIIPKLTQPWDNWSRLLIFDPLMYLYSRPSSTLGFSFWSTYQSWFSSQNAIRCWSLLLIHFLIFQDLHMLLRKREPKNCFDRKWIKKDFNDSLSRNLLQTVEWIKISPHRICIWWEWSYPTLLNYLKLGY